MVLGASFDSTAENKAFAEAQNFGYRLLSDVDRKVGESYQVTRSPDDERANFALRIAYLIDPAGVIRTATGVPRAITEPDDTFPNQRWITFEKDGARIEVMRYWDQPRNPGYPMAAESEREIAAWQNDLT